MSRKFARLIVIMVSIVMVASLLGMSVPTSAKPVQQAKIKVGLSFSDFATERWKIEDTLMTKLLQEKGYDVISQEANHDVKLQNDQIDNMVSQGIKALIVVAEDGDAAS